MGMFEFFTGMGLVVAVGLNVYILLLFVGLSVCFFDWIELFAGWAWFLNEWVLVVLGVLFVVEIVVDKIFAVDIVNDWV